MTHPGFCLLPASVIGILLWLSRRLTLAPYRGALAAVDSKLPCPSIGRKGSHGNYQ